MVHNSKETVAFFNATELENLKAINNSNVVDSDTGLDIAHYCEVILVGCCDVLVAPNDDNMSKLKLLVGDLVYLSDNGYPALKGIVSNGVGIDQIIALGNSYLTEPTDIKREAMSEMMDALKAHMVNGFEYVLNFDLILYHQHIALMEESKEEAEAATASAKAILEEQIKIKEQNNLEKEPKMSTKMSTDKDKTIANYILKYGISVEDAIGLYENARTISVPKEEAKKEEAKKEEAKEEQGMFGKAYSFCKNTASSAVDIVKENPIASAIVAAGVAVVVAVVMKEDINDVVIVGD